jgi:hypothetical protein
MNNTASRWHDLEVVEGSGSPLQEFESFVISLEFNFFVLFPCVFGSCNISLDTVINDQINWAQGVNFLWVSSESHHSISHGSQVDNSWDTSEVL